MDFQALIDSVGLYAASFIVGFVSGILFFVNIELYLVVVSPLVSRPALAPVALYAAAGHMAAKVLFFYTGRGALNMPLGRWKDKIEQVKRKVDDWSDRLDLLVFLSSFLGVPPFYPICILAGGTRLGVVRFTVVGLVGRVIRFLIVIYFPQAVMRFID